MASTAAAPYYQKQFLDAVDSSDATRLRRLLEERLTTVNIDVYNPDGQTALHQSCSAGNLELVKLLVCHGADVRLANRDGWSALHIAVYGGHRHIVRYLIDAAHRR